MANKKIVSLEDRVPKLQQRRQQKANQSLILYLSIFFLLMVGVLYFQSSFSHVGKIEVKGNRYVEENIIISLSQLTTDTNYWKVNKKNIGNNIKEHLEIASVEVDKQFPNKIVIAVKEYQRLAYLLDRGTYYPVLENGKVLRHLKIQSVADAPLLINWEYGPELQEMAAQLKLLPESVLNRISEIYYTPTKENHFQILLYMNDGNEVIASVKNFAKKIKAYPTIIEQLDPTVKGTLHLEVGSYFEVYEGEGAEQ